MYYGNSACCIRDKIQLRKRHFSNAGQRMVRYRRNFFGDRVRDYLLAATNPKPWCLAIWRVFVISRLIPSALRGPREDILKTKSGLTLTGCRSLAEIFLLFL